MRVGEVTVIGPRDRTKDIFIQSICEKANVVNERVSFGRLEISNQLSLHFYGIGIEREDTSISWDLLTPKMLGFIFIFNWTDYNSLATISSMLDYFSSSFYAPIVVIANIDNENDIPVPPMYFKQEGFILDPKIRLTFCNINNPSCTKKAVVNIINMLLSRLP